MHEEKGVSDSKWSAWGRKMSEQPGDEDRLFRILCARALQRNGKGFPSTEKEIKDSEAGLILTDKEKGRLASLVSRLIARAEASIKDSDASDASEKHREVLRRLHDVQEKGVSAAAARGAQADGISPELAKEIDRVIESESETDGADGQKGVDEFHREDLESR